MYRDGSDLEEVSAVSRGSSISDEVFEPLEAEETSSKVKKKKKRKEIKKATDKWLLTFSFLFFFFFFSKRWIQILIINRYNKNHSGIYKILKK